MHNSDDTTNLPRRDWMKAAAIGAGLALAPGAHVLARSLTTKPAPALNVGVGYLHGGAQRALANGGFVDASSMSASAANYQLRVLSASASQPLSIDAQYPNGAEHHFWQAWSEGGMLQHSSPTTLRWWAGDRSSLPLLVWYAGLSTLASITARPGTYALIVAGPGQSLPAWSVITLGGAGSTTKLLRQGQTLTLPNFVFEVSATDA